MLRVGSAARRLHPIAKGLSEENILAIGEQLGSDHGERTQCGSTLVPLKCDYSARGAGRSC